MNLANIISLLRLVSVPVFVWLVVKDHLSAAFWVFLAAAISDALDGIIAKKMNMQTTLGAYLDPIADKTLLVSAYIVLGYKGMLPAWLVILVVSRDMLIVGGALLFEKLTGALTMQPIFVSKINTALQLLLVLSVLGPTAFAFGVSGVVPSLTLAVGLSALVSGGAYVVIWSRRAHLMEQSTSERNRDEDRP